MIPSKPIRILLVDDHAVVRSGLAAFLMAFDDLQLVGEACNGEEAIRLCFQVQPDVAPTQCSTTLAPILYSALPTAGFSLIPEPSYLSLFFMASSIRRPEHYPIAMQDITRSYSAINPEKGCFNISPKTAWFLECLRIRAGILIQFTLN